MQSEERTRALLEVLEAHSQHTRAPEFIQGLIDGLKWVVGNGHEPGSVIAFAEIADRRDLRKPKP